VPLEVIAHRGASGTAPENTRAALDRAWRLGARWAEVDVQRTSDGILVLVHDDTWERTAGVAQDIASMPWDQARRLDVGAWFAAEFAGETPPSLDEVLESSMLAFDLEIKSPHSHPGLAADVVAAVRRHRAEDRVLLTCFEPRVVEEVADAAPDLQVGYLASAALRRTHPRISTYALHAPILLEDDAGYVDFLRARAARVLAWTVDDPAIGAALEAAGVSGVISNYPERWLERPSRRD
jgi:glycerophosphoryl diester phosphodiesterase